MPASKLSSRSTRPAPELEPHVRLSGAERREQLIRVAIDLFSRKGFNGTTTREIAAAAGVTEAIIFRHFETKEQLYLAIIDQKVNSPASAEWISALHASMHRDDDEAVIRLLIQAIVVTHRVDPKFERLMIYAALEGHQIALLYMQQITASIVEAFRSYFARRQQAGRLVPLAPDLALMAIAGIAQNYAVGKYVYALDKHCLSDEQAVKSFTDIALKGLLLPEVNR